MVDRERISGLYDKIACMAPHGTPNQEHRELGGGHMCIEHYGVRRFFSSCLARV